MQRRTLLKAGVAAGLFHIVPRHVLGGPGHVPPSEKIHLALVGCGGRGREVLKDMMTHDDVRAIAVADPARDFSTKSYYYRDAGGRESTRQLIEQRYQPDDAGFRCAAFANFEELLSEVKDLDAIICGTPDHLHAYVSIKSMRAGKHVYCEKPLTHNIWEAREVARVAAETGLATQMGNQGHSSEGMRKTVEWIQAGAVGTVRHVKAWVGAKRWNPTLSGRPTDQEPTPEGLDWDLWLGPREPIAFSSKYFPVAWRDFWAFGNSNIGDFACHDLDAACWALDLKYPTRIEFSPAGTCNADIGPHGCIGYYEFPATAHRAAVKVTWHDGGLLPQLPKQWPKDQKFPSRGVLFEGDEGVLYCGGAGGAPQVVGRPDYTGPEASIPRVASHSRDWLDAIRGGPNTGSNFQYGAKLTELAMLGALSLRTGQAIDWDGPNMTASDCPEATEIIREPYRAAWSLNS
ncbi:MAG: Gfo/Idh/MocA family oxidoreductase [Pirellulaceae bacterium]|nr:Gfo/Idh/MocA family oxidoreductase [Pirellulaceae bacterium]